MGGKNSRSVSKKELLLEYEEFKKEFDPRFEDVTIYRNKLKPELDLMITKEITFQRKEDYLLFQEKVKKRQDLISPNILELELVLGKLQVFDLWFNFFQTKVLHSGVQLSTATHQSINTVI